LRSFSELFGVLPAATVTRSTQIRNQNDPMLLFLTLFVVDLLELFVVVSQHFFSFDQITDG
jgi:hypothetical protein